MIQCLRSHIISTPAFDEDRLFSEFRDALVKEGILYKNEIKKFSSVKPALSLFAISAMHLCAIDIGDGTKATLHASRIPHRYYSNSDERMLGIWATIPPRKMVAYVTPIFVTSLDPTIYCDPMLLVESEPWTFPIELTANKVLAKI